MGKKHFLYVLGLLFVAAGLAGNPTQVHAANGKKPANSKKERLVLMPLRVGEADKELQGAMEGALVEGLQQKYEVFSGEQVAQKAHEIFMKESKTAHKDCDETRCMQGIAEAFQAELIATANVTKRGDGYFLALSIQNIFDNKVVYSKSTPCKNCDAYQVVDKLKELSGALVQTATASAEPEIAPTPVKGTDPDSTLWNEAQKGNTIDDYQVYLDTYPKGKYAPFAKARIKKLKAAAQAATEQQEQQAWDTAQQENSEDSYGAYLKGYPNGRFAGLAKVRSDKLKNDVTAKEETDMWHKADSSNDRAAVEGYLNKYPSGRYLAAASAKLKAIKEHEPKFPFPEMVRIPGKNYEIGKYDVTQKEWQTVMGNNPSHFSNCGDTCPVEQVSWDDAQAFIQKLNTKTGRQYRLPQEAEWEYACYGGNQTEYCGGNDIDSVAWYRSNSGSTTHPVGQKQANAYGLYDMSGNVWEWMSDCDKGDCAYRVLRGGSWNNKPQNDRAAIRIRNVPTYRNYNNGFRLARTLP
jgi:outer membrane protein assembly factor BamD (BamD/ComL family)